MSWSAFEGVVDEAKVREEEAFGIVSGDEQEPEQQEERLALEDFSDDEGNDKWSARE